MASIASPSAACLLEMFNQHAICRMEDQVLGERVEEMQKRGMPIESAYGLDFCKQNVFENEHVRHILKALFPWSGLGIYEVFRRNDQQPGIIYGFMTGLEPLKAVVVQLWSPNSKMVYYEGSHQLPIEGFPSPIGLLEIPYDPLRRADCTPIEVRMEKGGLAILDARLAFRIEKGYALHCVFATREELKGWPKKNYPNEEGLKEKAEEMENQTMGLNFTFTDK